MSSGNVRRLVLACVMLLGLAVFLGGIGCGLPSRQVDPFLFGDHPVWTGKQILDLSGGWSDDAHRGADVDANPIADRSQPLQLNATDAQRAAIVLRYRLYSQQPDEMITFRALSRMKPGQLQLDPGLYQYGGLWVYPIGAMLKAASILKLVTVTNDLTFYLDHPDQFGRFYIVARLYSALWGVVGIWAVFWIAYRITQSISLSAGAAMCFIFMPVVINMAHEAKPHLPGAVLILLAVIAASKYVATGATRWSIVAGALCGGAFGMVLSSLWGFSILPTMALLRYQKEATRRPWMLALAAVNIGLAVYCVTNPYVWINAIWHPEILKSNLQNSKAMYDAGHWSGGILNAGSLLLMGASPVLAVVGVAGALILLCKRRGDVLILLLIPCLSLGVQFFAYAAGKPPEYARFGLLIDAFLAIAGVSWIGFVLRKGWPRGIAAALLVLAVAAFGAKYSLAFAGSDGFRKTICQNMASAGTKRIGVYFEPAPFSLPACDLFESRIVLLPKGAVAGRVGADVDRVIGPAGFGFFKSEEEQTPMSWASKRFLAETAKVDEKDQKADITKDN